MKYLCYIIFIFIFSSCKSIDTRQVLNLNNTYQVGKEYVYRYSYSDHKNEKFLFKFDPPFFSDGSNAIDINWELVNMTEMNSVSFFSMEPLNGFINSNQIPIKYKYYQENNPSSEEVTGLIQDNERVWLHPPRTKGFRILELNPFLEIRSPLKKGFSWENSLTISDSWADERWKLWNGKVNFKTEYLNRGQVELKTNMGVLNCYLIEAKSKSNIGVTKTIMFFNIEYGFVKVIYHNINKSKLIIELIEIIN